MHDIRFESPRSVQDALQILSEAGPDTRVIAGGTNVVIYLRERMIRPTVLVDVSRMPAWRGITADNGHIMLGPNCTVSDLLKSPKLVDGGQLLGSAAAWFAGPSIRNRATLAGNIADASPAADLTVPLLALDAEVESSRAGTSPYWTELDRFVLGPRKTALQPDELITSLRIRTTPGAEVAYFKLGKRDSMAISIVSIAILTAFEGSLCTKARIALGAVAPAPFRSRKAEESLVGKPLTQATAAEAGKLARLEARPISDIRGSARYRTEMIEVLVARLLADIARRRERG